MKIFVTRHGQTEWNVLKKVMGRKDLLLSKTGEEQARKTRDSIKDLGIDLIISSPLIRTKQTAMIINELKNKPIIYSEEIIERDFGEFEGLNTEEFNFKSYWSYKDNNIYEKAENITDFFNRVYKFLDELKDKYPDKNILIVTHGGVSIPINCYFNGIPEDDNLLSLVLGNCEVIEYNYKTKMK